MAWPAGGGPAPPVALALGSEYEYYYLALLEWYWTPLRAALFHWRRRLTTWPPVTRVAG